MIKILKRLELIKTAIAIEDEEIIELQVVKLSTLDIDEKVANILTMIKSGDYGKVAISIEDYISKYSGMVVYEDAEVQGLRLELKALEKKLRKLSEEKTEILNGIDEFNSQYNLKLGELLQKILSIRKEILKQKALQKEQEYVQVKEEYDEAVEELGEVEKHKEDIAQKLQDADLDEYDELFEELKNVKQEYDDIKEKVEEKEKVYEELKEEKEKERAEHTQAEEEYEEFTNHYFEELTEEHLDLTEEEKKELKKLYRKASKLCHPDIVDTSVKEQAEQIFIALSEAYVKNDLEEVREIFISLEKGIKFDIASDSISDAEILKVKIAELRKKFKQETGELDEIKNDESYEIIEDLVDWDLYFDGLETELNDEVERLQKVLDDISDSLAEKDDAWMNSQIKTQEEELLPFSNLKGFPFTNGYMKIEKIIDAYSDDVPFDTMIVDTLDGKSRISVPTILKENWDLLECEDWMLVATSGYFHNAEGYNLTLVPKDGIIPEGYYNKNSKLYTKYRPRYVSAYRGAGN